MIVEFLYCDCNAIDCDCEFVIDEMNDIKDVDND